MLELLSVNQLTEHILTRQPDGLPLLEEFIAKGGDVNSKDDNKRSLLGAASMVDNAVLVRHLLKAGANVLHQDNFNMNALMHASLNGDAGVVKMLLDAAKKDLNLSLCATDKYGDSALTLGADTGVTEIVKLLLEAGAPIDHQNKHGESALIVAAVRAHLSTIQLLLHGCADLQLVDIHDNTAMSLVKMLVGIHGGNNTALNTIRTYLDMSQNISVYSRFAIGLYQHGHLWCQQGCVANLRSANTTELQQALNNTTLHLDLSLTRKALCYEDKYEQFGIYNLAYVESIHLIRNHILQKLDRSQLSALVIDNILRFLPVRPP